MKASNVAFPGKNSENRTVCINKRKVAKYRNNSRMKEVNLKNWIFKYSWV